MPSCSVLSSPKSTVLVLLDPEDEGVMILRNVFNCSSKDGPAALL